MVAQFQQLIFMIMAFVLPRCISLAWKFGGHCSYYNILLWAMTPFQLWKEIKLTQTNAVKSAITNCSEHGLQESIKSNYHLNFHFAHNALHVLLKFKILSIYTLRNHFFLLFFPPLFFLKKIYKLEVNNNV